MPLYEYECVRCAHREEHLRPRSEDLLRFPCLMPSQEEDSPFGFCGGSMVRIMSKPGYRRDHTVLEK
jgi:hypothetical protein